MLPAAKNPPIELWFRWYTRRYLRRSFHRVLWCGELPSRPAGPLIICSNHSSWWDMLAAFWIATDLLGWEGYGPMDERQLRRYAILRRIGVFGVDRESLRGGREFLDYATGLLAGTDRALWITAQGELVSTDVRPIRFYSGPACLAERLLRETGRCAYLSVALDYEFWDEKRPELLIRFGTVRELQAEPGLSRKAILRWMETDLEAEMDALGELRRRRDVSQFQQALADRPGGGGVSPVYDLLRSVSARLRRENAPREHGAVLTPPRWGPASARRRRTVGGK